MAKIEFAAKNEYTEKYDDFVLGRLINGEDTELMYIRARVVNADGDDVLVAEPYVRKGSEVKPLTAVWSRQCVTPEDRELIKNFRPVDAIIRFATGEYATYIDKDGNEQPSKPKLVCLIDANRNVLFLSGAKREFKGEE